MKEKRWRRRGKDIHQATKSREKQITHDKIKVQPNTKRIMKRIFTNMIQSLCIERRRRRRRGRGGDGGGRGRQRMRVSLAEIRTKAFDPPRVLEGPKKAKIIFYNNVYMRQGKGKR